MLTKEKRVFRQRVPSLRCAQASVDHPPRLVRAGLAAALIALVAGCGGGTPLGNPPDIPNGGGGTGGRQLSFAYFQRCINPIFLASLPIIGSNPPVTNTCGGAGCHDDANGAGGAFRVRPSAAPVSLLSTADVIRASDMYKNYYSAQGEVTFNSVPLSRLITKPLVRGVLHGGGQIFANDLDPNVQKLLYWMTNPIPVGQDELTTDLPGGPTCP
ncbi:hypothetical protein LRS03_07960 [Rhizobacter sp. J219]|jgi:hypothetical protein|uniref:hypothetical protein n=1 Tax=Rhizobacter sp. J219 TaxID=2898430 RepID=UPI0021508B3F|nr:hypothetical protein [Rhizobacter sp. J219]MCR5882790.1 hypothetical protein [Rhizobacter sp. J219]